MAMTIAANLETGSAEGVPPSARPTVGTRFLSAVALEKCGEILHEGRVADRGRVHAFDRDSLPRSEPGDRAEHRDAMIAVRIDRTAAQSAAANDPHAVLEWFGLAAQGRQRRADSGDAVGLLAPQLGRIADRGLAL